MQTDRRWAIGLEVGGVFHVVSSGVLLVRGVMRAFLPLDPYPAPSVLAAAGALGLICATTFALVRAWRLYRRSSAALLVTVGWLLFGVATPPLLLLGALGFLSAPHAPDGAGAVWPILGALLAVAAIGAATLVLTKPPTTG
jgi:hypothetical protein